nr:hypothetical protein [Candidatus Levybacteria bacterium]
MSKEIHIIEQQPNSRYGIDEISREPGVSRLYRPGEIHAEDRSSSVSSMAIRFTEQQFNGGPSVVDVVDRMNL